MICNVAGGNLLIEVLAIDLVDQRLLDRVDLGTNVGGLLFPRPSLSTHAPLGSDRRLPILQIVVRGNIPAKNARNR